MSEEMRKEKQEGLREEQVHDSPNGKDASAEEVENGGEPEEQFLEEEQAEVVELEDAAHQKFLRLMAEFDNFRRRSAREKAQERQRGRRDAAEKLLPVFDSLTSGLLTMKEDDPNGSGMEAVLNQLVTSFKQLGITKIDTKGQPFDPELMEAIAQFPSEDFEKGCVMEESRPGFQDEIGLLRPAQVIVSSGPAE